MEKEFRPYGRQPNSPRFRGWKWIFAAIVLFYVVVYMPTPYVIYTPGSAEEVKPFINVEGGDETEEGTFLLTTVRRTYANLALIAWRAFDPNAEFGKKEEALQGRTEQEYINEQLFNMSNSQMVAILAAYNQVGIPYKIESEGIYVLFNNKQLADNEFITNDRIMEVEGQKVNGFDDLQAALKGGQPGRRFRLSSSGKASWCRSRRSLSNSRIRPAAASSGLASVLLTGRKRRLCLRITSIA